MPQERVKAIMKSKVDPTWKLLLVAIASYMSDEQLFIWAKPETLAEDTGLSRSTVMAALAEMQARGVVTRTDEGRKSLVTRIIWSVLAIQEPVKSTRGGPRVKGSGVRTEGSDSRTVPSDVRTPPSDSRTEGSDVRTDRGPIIGLEGSDVRTRSDHRTHHHDPTTEPTSEYVPPVPVATPPLTTPEAPACAPPQAIPTSALESTARDATNTQAGLFGQATAATVDSPKKPKKASAKANNDEAVGKVWATYRKHHPLCRETISVSDGKMVAAALKDWSAEQLCRMVDWAHTSKHERALFLQDGGYLGIDNLFRAGKIAARVELAEAEAGPVTRPHQAPEPVAPPEDPAAIWDEVIRLRSRGIRVCPDDIPPRTKDAIRAAGGWNQLGLLNEYTERQARTTFITAYRNNIPPLNGHPRNA